MPLTLDQLREEALSLPEEERRNLVDCLSDSFELEDGEEEEFSPQYTAELDRRSAEIANGTAVMIPYEAVQQHIDNLLRKR